MKGAHISVLTLVCLCRMMSKASEAMVVHTTVYYMN